MTDDVVAIPIDVNVEIIERDGKIYLRKDHLVDALLDLGGKVPSSIRMTIMDIAGFISKLNPISDQQ